MVSLPSSEAGAFAGFLDASGVPIEAPPEWVPALVVLSAPETDWTGITVARNGERLPVGWRILQGVPRLLADWPRAGAGNYRLQIVGVGEPASHVVTVKPRKITDVAFAALIEALQARLPTSIAVALQRLGALSGLSFAPPGQTTLAQELLRIGRALLGTGSRSGLAELLPQIGADPHVMLQTTELWVLRHRARRPTPARLARAVAAPGNVMSDGLLQRVVDTRVEESADIYENRLVRSFAEQVQQRLQRLLSALEATGQIAQADKARQLQVSLVRARRRAPFLKDVAPLATAPDHVTMVLLREPRYRQALEGFVEFQRSLLVHLDDRALDTPLEELPSLYQSWGTLCVLDAVLQVGEEKGYRVSSQRLVSRRAGEAYVRILRDGSPAMELSHARSGARVRFIPERSYARGGLLRSLSFAQVPDVAVEVYHPGRASRVALFDPKYKLDSDPAGSRPVKGDIDKMHAYRDAIRDAEGNRVVVSADIIYPGTEHLDAGGVGALVGIPGQEEDLVACVRERLREAL